MKPLGRKYYKDNTGGKHSLRVEGKHLCWWEDVCSPNKRLEQRNVHKEIEEGLELYGDLVDDNTLDDCDIYCEYYHDTCDGTDIFCQDGLCPDCNYDKYVTWITDHTHCDTGSWDCPDEEDCPWKKGLFDFKE